MLMRSYVVKLNEEELEMTMLERVEVAQIV